MKNNCPHCGLDQGLQDVASPRKRPHKTTFYTPTLQAMRASPRISKVLGWMLTILFIFALIMLFIGIFTVLYEPAGIIKSAMLGALIAMIYGVFVCVYLVDTLASIDELASRTEENTKKAEEHLYNIYRVICQHLLKESSQNKKD